MDELKKWFCQNKRSFPWREDPSPYKVWVSEVMLQQTRAGVVVGYFCRWMEIFPNIESLAKASEDQVLKSWEGLGYYSRARNLHEGAKSLIAREFPACKEELLQIKGIGSYTAGAILSFAFHKKAAAVDANVRRVVARYFGLEDPSKALLEEKTESLLSEEEPWIVMEALIELGATVCSLKPSCWQCPLSCSCVAYKEGKTALIPKKKERKDTVHLVSGVLVILREGGVLIEYKKKGKVLGGLAQFPSLPYDQGKRRGIWDWQGLKLEWMRDLSEQRQTYTVYREDLFPSLWKSFSGDVLGDFTWIPKEDLPHLTFTSGHKRILQQILQEGILW